MMRALVMDFPDDPKARDVQDQYLFGPAFLVSPVTEPGVVYPPGLPAGGHLVRLLDTAGRSKAGGRSTRRRPTSRCPSMCGPARSCPSAPPSSGRARSRPTRSGSSSTPVVTAASRSTRTTARRTRTRRAPSRRSRCRGRRRTERSTIGDADGSLRGDARPKEPSRWPSSGPQPPGRRGARPRARPRGRGATSPTAPCAIAGRRSSVERGTTLTATSPPPRWPRRLAGGLVVTLLLAVAVVAAWQLQRWRDREEEARLRADPHPRGNGGAAPRVPLRDPRADPPGVGLPAPAARP